MVAFCARSTQLARFPPTRPRQMTPDYRSSPTMAPWEERGNLGGEKAGYETAHCVSLEPSLRRRGCAEWQGKSERMARFSLGALRGVWGETRGYRPIMPRAADTHQAGWTKAR
jgi:hypothetical protein